MTSQVYYRKWRPGSFAQLVGQEHVATTLRQSVKQGRVSHSYLFCGPRGSGKTTTARIVGKAVNCLDLQDGDPCNACSICLAIIEGRFMDIIELDAASNRGIDEIRDIREKVNFAPAQGSRKVYIIDEAHMLTDAASNAFLKTLEEPPGHVIFILCTTEAHKILPTIVSRCQRFDFRRLPSDLVYGRLAEIVDAEGVVVEPEALRLVARYAAGSLRDAQNLLEQLVVSYGDGVGVQQVEDLLGLGHGERWLDLVKYLLMGNTSASLDIVNQAAWDGTDLRQVHRQTLELLRAVLLLQWGSGASLDLPDHAIKQLGELVGHLPPWRIVKAVKVWSEISLRYDAPSTLPLELAIVEICQEQAESADGRAEPAASPSVSTSPRAARRPAAAPSPAPPVQTETREPNPNPTVAPQPVASLEADIPPSDEATEELKSRPTGAPQPVASLEADIPPPDAATGEPKSRPTGAPQPVASLEADIPPPDAATGEPKSRPTGAPQPVASLEADIPPSDEATGEPVLIDSRVETSGDVAGAWAATVKALAKHKGKKYNLGALLRDCRSDSISLDADTLVMAFSHRTHMERMQEEMDDPKGRRLLTDAVAQFFGRSYEFKLTIIEGAGGASPRTAQSSPLVRAAMGMGARILEEVVE